MQKKNNLFIIMLLIMTLFFGFMSNPVVGYVDATDYIIDWDRFTVGATSGSWTWYNFERTSGLTGYVINSPVNDSIKSLNFAGGVGSGEVTSEVEINFDFNNSFVDCIKIPFKIYYPYETTYWYSSYTFFRGSLTVLRFNIFTYGATRNIQVLTNETGDLPDNDVGWNKLMTSYPRGIVNDWILQMNFTEGNNNCAYSLYNETGVFLSSNFSRGWNGYTFTVQDWDYFDKVYIKHYMQQSVTDSSYHRLGNLEIDIDEDFFLSDDYPVEQWLAIGNPSKKTNEHTAVLENAYYEQKYRIALNTVVRAVDLYIPVEQYNEDSDINNYWIRLGRDESVYGPFQCFNPTVFIPYQSDYLLRWYWINTTYNNSVASLEFFHQGDIFKVGTSIYDHDNDGTTEYYQHFNHIYGLNNVYDNPSDGYTSTTRDISYVMYVDDIPMTPPDVPEIDTIDTNVNTVDIFNPINIIYETTDLSTINKLVVNDGSTDVYNESITAFRGNYWYVPELATTHTASLFRDNITVVSCSFTVNDVSQDYYIYTRPNPSKVGESFTVYFNYSGAVPCAIILYDANNNYITKWLYDIFPIKDDFTYTLSTEGIYYFDLCYITNISGETYYTVKKRHQHIVKNEHSNNIYAVYDIIDWNFNTDAYHYNTIRGEHNFLGCDIVITFNNVDARQVGSNSIIFVNYQPRYSGIYTVNLVLRLSDSDIILATTQFSVTESGIEPPEEEDEWLVLGDYKIWLGVGIIVLFLLLPLAISISSFVDVPLIVYIAMGAVGTGISVSLGLLEMYWLLLMLVALVTGAVLSKWGGL